jgi:hypothetical protein
MEHHEVEGTGGDRYERSRALALQRIRTLQMPLPANWRFDREEANSRQAESDQNR